MMTLNELGGVRVFGKGQEAWSTEEGRTIASMRAVFDSDFRVPDAEKDEAGPYFALPCHRGKEDYEIHLLDTGEAIVIKDGEMHLCTQKDGKPQVLRYEPFPAYREAACAR